MNSSKIPEISDSEEEFDNKRYCLAISKPACFIVSLPILFGMSYFIPYMSNQTHTENNISHSNFIKLNYLEFSLALLALIGLAVILKPLSPAVSEYIYLRAQSIFSPAPTEFIDPHTDVEMGVSSEGRKLSINSEDEKENHESNNLGNDSLAGYYGSMSESRNRLT